MLGRGRLDFAGGWCWSAGPVVAGGDVLPVLPGACLLWDWVGVCAACVPGPALCWPAGVCACVRMASGPAWPACSAATWENSRLFPARIGGTVPAAWWSWCRVDRLPGLLPVPLVMCGRLCGRVCVYSLGGDAGGIMAGLWACFLLWIVGLVALENTEILQKNSPEKRPRKNFSKNFPLWGNGLRREFFCKKGVDNRTQQCYALATTAARNSATQTQNGGTKP